MTALPVATALEALGCHHATVDLFKSIERRPHSLPSIKVLAAELDYTPNALASRVFRAGLPSLADILRRLRLVGMRRLLAAHPELNEAQVAVQSGWSEAAALSRHLRDYCHQTYHQWRDARTSEEELEALLDDLIRSRLYAPRWRAFRLFDDRMAA